IQEIKKSKHINCFIGKPSSEIIALFGKPTFVDKNFLRYSVGKICGEGEYPSIYILSFVLTNNKVSDIQFSKIFEE
ncbi:MAG: hypothetical protein RLZZ292_1142, partial [Bacteroidota bacterium]